MTRREVLRLTALMAGAAVATPVATSLLSGCQSAPTPTPFAPSFFTPEQYNFINEIVNTILPSGEIPGAIDVGVPQVIDHMVGVVYSPEDRKLYASGINLIMESFRTKNAAKAFEEYDAQIKTDWLKDFELQLKLPVSEEEKNIDLNQIVLTDEEGKVAPLSEVEIMALIRHTYPQLKQQTIAYFLSSEEISVNHLNYLPVPGKYEACIPLESVGGKAWAI